jgi:hypothetical protein
MNSLRDSWILLAMAAAALHAPEAFGQVNARTTVATLWESYSFEQGLGFRRLSELSTPVVVGIKVRERAALVISSGYARVLATAEAPGEDVSVSGLLDTEARLTLDVVPRRISLVLSGIAPTGITEISGTGAPVLGLVAAEALDFSVVRLGSGGGVGGGVVAAIPVGSFAIGLAATATRGRAFTPLEGGDVFEPGGDLRVRLGAEGPIGRETYLRVAGILSLRKGDRFGEAPQAEPGPQASVYAAVEQGSDRSNLTLYVFGSLRSAPRAEQSAVGLAVLPESRTLVIGSRWAIAVRGRDTITPSVEYRVSDAAALPDGEGGTGDLNRLGQSVRLGAAYRLRASSRASVVLEVSALTGEVRGPQPERGLSGVGGFRGGMRLEWRP